MSAILKVKIPFYRRLTNGGTDGYGTFYLTEKPVYIPSANQVITITHTDIPSGSGLYTKLHNISTNTVSASFVQFYENVDQESVKQSDGYSNFFQIQYNDFSFSTNQYGGDCRGYIEYDVNPTAYQVLKPIETPVIVSESVPFDLQDGYSNVDNVVTGGTYPTNFLKGMFVKRDEKNSIFMNLLKSLNLPVSDQEMKKYTRSALGAMSIATGATYDTIINGTKYTWTPWTSTGTTTTPLVVHPITGYTGEYYGTVLQTIGSYDYLPTNKAALPVENELYLLFEIPNSTYGEIIDGKSVKFTLPYYTGVTTGVYNNDAFGVYTYSGTPGEIALYGTYNTKNLTAKNLDRVLSEIDLSMQDLGIRPNMENLANYESNVVPLFCDNILAPQGNNLSSWADGWVDLIDGVRVFNPNGIEKATYDYYQDQCVGYVALDKGFIVITHPKIVDSYFTKIFSGTTSVTGNWSTGYKSYNVNGTMSTAQSRGLVKTDPTKMLVTVDDTSNVDWDSTQFVFTATGATTGITSEVSFLSYNTEKSLNIVCLASSDEFFKSTNDTAKELLDIDPNADYADFKSSTSDLYPTIITSVGLHDANGNLLAICKPAQPIKKYWYDVTSFNIKIRL